MTTRPPHPPPGRHAAACRRWRHRRGRPYVCRAQQELLTQNKGKHRGARARLRICSYWHEKPIGLRLLLSNLKWELRLLMPFE